MTNVLITKGNSDNNGLMMKKFTKKMQESGVLPRLRSIRYNERALSFYKIKKAKLRNLKRKEEIQTLIKLGKPVGNTKKR